MKRELSLRFGIAIIIAAFAIGCGGSDDSNSDNIGNAFVAIDQDNNGSISLAEWTESNLPADTFANSDSDGDGALNTEEFAQAIGGSNTEATNTEFANSETPSTEEGPGTEVGAETGVSTENGGESNTESGSETGSETGNETGGETCSPSCAGVQCGDDGCGGVCGVCAPGTACTESGTCECTPSCEGVDCGDDGCGGSCGTCDGTGTCLGGHCVEGCTTAGTGNQIGDVAKNISWTTSDSGSVDLHSFCAVKKAVVVIETASW